MLVFLPVWTAPGEKYPRQSSADSLPHTLPPTKTGYFIFFLPETPQKVSVGGVREGTFQGNTMDIFILDSLGRQRHKRGLLLINNILWVGLLPGRWLVRKMRCCSGFFRSLLWVWDIKMDHFLGWYWKSVSSDFSSVWLCKGPDLW